MSDSDYRQSQADRIRRLQEYAAGKDGQVVGLLGRVEAQADVIACLENALERLAEIARLRSERIAEQADAIAGLKDDLECARAAADRHRRFAEAESARALAAQAQLDPARRPPEFPGLEGPVGPGRRRRPEDCTCDLCTRSPS